MTFLLKPMVEWRQLSHFPAKMSLVHAGTLLSIEEISFSLSPLSQNQKVSLEIAQVTLKISTDKKTNKQQQNKEITKLLSRLT